MTEVSVAPTTMTAVARSDNPTGPLKKALVTTESNRDPLIQIKANIARKINEIKEKNPQVPKASIELVSHILFGPLLLEPREYKQAEISEQEKENLARIQHHLTHGIFFAGTADSPIEYSLKMQSIPGSSSKCNRNMV